MYLIAFHSKYFMAEPETLEVSNRAAVSCLTHTFNNQRISYVVLHDGYTLDKSFFNPQSEKLLSVFVDEVEA